MTETTATRLPTITEEPPDGALVLRQFDGHPEALYVRDDAAADDGEYGDQHWHLVEPIDGEYPMTWANVVEIASGSVLVRLYRESEVTR